MLPLESIFNKHRVSFHCYADDTHIYVPFKQNDDQSLNALTACMSDIKTWMSINFLHLNKSKTQAVMFGPLAVSGNTFQALGNLKNIIKSFLTFAEFERVIHAFISSRLQLSVYIGIRQSYINCLQTVQNAAARLQTGTRKYEHITPILLSLHWLPVCFRIEFKILLFVFKVLN